MLGRSSHDRRERWVNLGDVKWANLRDVASS